MSESELLQKMRELMDSVSASHRLEIVSVILAPYCRHCGYDDPDHRCQCWNDD